MRSSPQSGTGTSASSTRPTATPCTSTARGHQQEERPIQGGGEDRREGASPHPLTATPHSGRTESLWGLLRLLDPDAYGDRCPKHIELNEQQYRKVAKEEHGRPRGEKLFNPRHPHTIGYELDGPELDLYDAVTEFVSKKLVEIRGENARGVAGFALTAMQRRLASSVRAIRLTLDRRVAAWEGADDIPAYLRKQKASSIDLPRRGRGQYDLDEDDLWRLEEKALGGVAPRDRGALRLELEEFAAAAWPWPRRPKQAGTERKLNELLDVVNAEGPRRRPTKKLLIFTEHRDTLRYLVEKLEPRLRGRPDSRQPPPC